MSNNQNSVETLLSTWRTTPRTEPFGPWPRLFWTAEESDRLRAAMASEKDRIRARADEVIADPDVFASEPAWHYRHQAPMLDLATAAWIAQEERLVSLATRLIDRAASTEDWVAAVHKPMECDHVAANVGATVARCMDLLAGRLTDDHIRRYREAIREKCLDPFLSVCRNRSEWWAKRDCPSNWRIMTCGDAGLAALGTLSDEDDADEILAYATEGVLDILDTIPEDGDFVEGPHYFLGTLGMGLRYLLALSRIRPEAADWLRHPKLEKVGQYLIHTTTPGGETFNYFDNGLTWSDLERAYMLLLARTQKRPELAALGRDSDPLCVEQVAFDDAGLVAEPPAGPTSLHFRTSGLVTCRTAWSDDAAYLAFRCGPSTFGHSHLDSGSFIYASGSTRFVIDEGIWPYAHRLGFFHTDAKRWDFDANATVAHNTLLIDGQGQVFGEDHAGRVAFFKADDTGAVTACDLAATYENSVTECTRWFAFLPDGVVVIYDRIRSPESCHVEQLFHLNGTVTGDDESWTVEKDGKTLVIRRLPGRQPVAPWRVGTTERTTYYTASSGDLEERTIRYRSWGPINADTAHDLVTVLGTESTPALDITDDAVKVTISGRCITFRPETPEGVITSV